MRWRAHVTSVGLTIAAAAAVAYAYLDRGSVTESEKKARDGSVFVAWRREDLSRITIDHGAEHVVLDRTRDDAGDADWWLRAPVADRGDQEACDKLLSSLELATVTRKVAPDAKSLGLDAPRARGEIVMGAVTHRFVLGGDAPSPPGSAYLQREGAGVVVVSQDLVTALMQPADTYRSRQIVPYVSVQLARLEVKGQGSDVRIERADDVSFRLAPSGLRASRSKLDAIWGALGEMRAEAFVTEDVAAPLVASPAETITMTPSEKDAKPGALRVGAECPGHPEDVVVTRDAPTRLSACAPRGVLSGLATTEAALEDRHLFAAHDDEVAEARLESLSGGAGPIDLARKDSGWRLRAPEERDLGGEEAEAATALVRGVAGAEGDAPRKSDDPFEPKQRVTLQRAGGVTEIVELSAPDARGDVVARRAFDGARLLVLAETARKLRPRGVALRGHEVWTPPVEGLAVTSIETRCDDVAQRLTHDGDAWTLALPAKLGGDNAAVVGLIDAVTRLRAQSWVADADDGTFGFGGCFLSLGVQGDGGDRELRVELGRAAEGGVYARTSQGPAVFVAPATLGELARAWLVNLHGFAFEGDEVQLERDGKQVAVRADGGADATQAALDAARTLRADSVAHLGPARPAEGFARPSLVIATRAGAGRKRVVVGAEVEGDGKRRYARVDGVEATFEIDADRLRPFYDRF
jgi:hypothetical protein